LERSGVTHLPKPEKRPAKPAADSKRVAKAVASPMADPIVRALPPGPAPAQERAGTPGVVRANESLAVIQQEVAACVRCPELAATRTQTVFGVGDPHARLVFIGEAPGADEDAQGEPFVGRAGQLLTKIIEACNLRREDVYILNVLKCRPPGNRPPERDEIANCRGYLERQLAVIRPEFICCLGTHAAQTLLKSDLPIGKLRGRFLEYEGATVVCTYHPSYLLRNPPAKKDVWEDMKMLLRKMGVELG